MQARSPRIVDVSWGRIEVEEVGVVKDLKVWPGGGRAWDWGETGTRHSPGVQVADVEELLEHGATVVVLSLGMDEQLGVPDATVDALEARGIEVHVAETREAIDVYNSLVGSAAVGGLFHSTC
ncbi:Mth938-like domain-containing protein [Dactylosporangium sp. NPDC050588]|uniref:Mth938-like domain-containing protein n=1 Tax=Dactylosporangium sp. NPDC050588 TaxID=3157211 RepID=UPI0033FA4D3F